MSLPARVSRAAAPALLFGGLCAALAVDAQQHCNGGSSLPPARFQDNGDGTITDRQSQLMWMRCASGQRWLDKRCVGAAESYDWADARRHADLLSRTGDAFFNDWRVPALRELATITDRGCRNPRTNLSVFPDTPAAAFWSSTPQPSEGTADRTNERALALSFGAEGVVLARKAERLHLRLVRTGP